MGKKFTFKMKDRMKITLERVATNACTLTVSGKDDTVFRFSKNRAADLLNCFYDVINNDAKREFDFKKTKETPAGYIVLYRNPMSESFHVIIREYIGSRKYESLFEEAGISRKDMKKMYKVVKEVYGLV